MGNVTGRSRAKGHSRNCNKQSGLRIIYAQKKNSLRPKKKTITSIYIYIYVYVFLLRLPTPMPPSLQASLTASNGPRPDVGSPVSKSVNKALGLDSSGGG